jgi:hypothetical protein
MIKARFLVILFPSSMALYDGAMHGAQIHSKFANLQAGVKLLLMCKMMMKL